MKDSDFQIRGMPFDMKAYERMFLRLVDIHRFGDWRIFLDEEPDTKAEIAYDPKTTPPWIIHREDLLAISDLHRRLTKDIAAADIPTEQPETSEGFLVFLGGCIVSKVILLIHCLLLSYNYYKVRSVPYPGRTASSYLNPEIVPDLGVALTLTDLVLFEHRDEHPYLRTRSSATSMPR